MPEFSPPPAPSRSYLAALVATALLFPYVGIATATAASATASTTRRPRTSEAGIAFVRESRVDAEVEDEDEIESFFGRFLLRGGGGGLSLPPPTTPSWPLRSADEHEDDDDDDDETPPPPAPSPAIPIVVGSSVPRYVCDEDGEDDVVGAVTYATEGGSASGRFSSPQIQTQPQTRPREVSVAVDLSYSLETRTSSSSYDNRDENGVDDGDAI